MLVKKISFVRPNLFEEAPDIVDYNLDIFVELEDGQTYTVVITTAKNIMSLIDKEKTNFSEPGDPFIIARKLTKKIIEEAIKAYVENNTYLLKFQYFAERVDTDVFNQLQAEHTQYLKKLNARDNF